MCVRLCVCGVLIEKFVCDFHQLIICLSFNEIFCTCPPPSLSGPSLLLKHNLTIKNTKH